METRRDENHESHNAAVVPVREPLYEKHGISLTLRTGANYSRIGIPCRIIIIVQYASKIMITLRKVHTTSQYVFNIANVSLVQSKKDRCI
jgi:hypothetical protein